MITSHLNQNFYYSSLLNDYQYFSFFGTKIQGDGRNIKNILDFFQSQKIPLKKIVLLDQIHSANIVFYTKTNDNLIERISDCDGAITYEPLTALVVLTADCQPIIFVDKKKGLIGISHQGWRGSVKKLPQKMIEKMKNLGSNEKNIMIAQGPAIGPCCYEIDNDRYYSFLEEFNGYSDKIFIFFKGKRYLNLSYLNYLQILEKGVIKRNIDFFPFCTSCQKKAFFSFRREKKQLKGEMINFILKLS